MAKIVQKKVSKPRTPARTDTGLGSQPAGRSMAVPEPAWTGGPSLAGHVAIDPTAIDNRKKGAMLPKPEEPTGFLFEGPESFLD